jgi:UDP-N-acetylmuramoyl-tripeptide--D-alanyl-D-alanine ligase
VVVAGLSQGDATPQSVEIEADGRARVRVDGSEFQLPYPGRHLAANAMLAWAVARELGLEPAAVAAALGRFRLPGGRSELLEQGSLTILNDCYNANPQSFASAIATARAMRAGRRLVFVAGTMRELGPAAERLHAEVAADLVALDPELLAAVGEFVPALAPYAGRLGDRLIAAADPAALGPELARRLHGGELVVLKASRGVALERILPFLVVSPTSAPEV